MAKNKETRGRTKDDRQSDLTERGGIGLPMKDMGAANGHSPNSELPDSVACLLLSVRR